MNRQGFYLPRSGSVSACNLGSGWPEDGFSTGKPSTAGSPRDCHGPLVMDGARLEREDSAPWESQKVEAMAHEADSSLLQPGFSSAEDSESPGL